MYHLVFSSNKHKQASYRTYGRQNKINRASTYNQFELDTIRSSMKSRWELHGAGSLKFQQDVWQLEMKSQVTAPGSNLHKYMNGHIITVETPTDAMWFRLNHENVSKNSCKLVEMYRDLDTDFISEQVAEYLAEYSVKDKHSTNQYFLNNASNHIRRFLSEISITTPDDQIETANMLSTNLSELAQRHSSFIDSLHASLKKKSDAIYNYIESKRTSIS